MTMQDPIPGREGSYIPGLIPDHDDISNQIDTEIYFLNEDEVGIEAYVGRFSLDVLDVDEDITEICRTLAWCAHSSDMPLMALNEAADCFYTGEILALKTYEIITNRTGAPLATLLKYWKRQSEHAAIAGAELDDTTAQVRIMTHMRDKVAAHNPVPGYVQLLDKIINYEAFENDDASALYGGFMYMFTTLLDANNRYDRMIHNRIVTSEMQGIDEELTRLLSE